MFGNLPSDGSNSYVLTAGLYRYIGDPASAQAPGYSVLPNKVGEGVSAGFSIAPGTTANVTVTLNAVGDLVLDSQKYLIDPANPSYVTTDTTAFVDTKISAAKDPGTSQLRVAVYDYALVRTVSTTVAPFASWSAAVSATVSGPPCISWP